MKYTINKLSEIAGVSVRTLHYYDEVGLLKPSFVAENGYRFYSEKEVSRLQQILFYKELEFKLSEIKKITSSPNFNELKALEEQKKLLVLKRKRVNKLIETITKTIEEMKGGEKKMTNDDKFKGFDIKKHKEYQEEAEKRWGNTDAYRKSQERTKNWTKEDYKRAYEEGDAFNKLLGETMDKGFDSPEFQALVEKHYKRINDFYDCSLEMYKALADMYIADARFTKTYEDIKPGLAEFMRKAIYYYCEKNK